MKQGKLILLGCALVGTLSACGSAETAKPATSSGTTSSPAAPAAGIPSKPDAATQAAYIADLDAIDPDIVHNRPDTAVSRGRDLCSKWAPDRAKVVEQARQRFTSPSHPDGYGPAVAGQIADVVHTRLCPSY